MQKQGLCIEPARGCMAWAPKAAWTARVAAAASGGGYLVASSQNSVNGQPLPANNCNTPAQPSESARMAYACNHKNLAITCSLEQFELVCYLAYALILALQHA